METIPLDIPGLRLIAPRIDRPEMGEITYFFDEAAFGAAQIELDIRQEHGSLYAKRWTVRGLHAQRAPHEQTKLVRVARGRIFDVVVDVRIGSPTFGRHVARELSADNRLMMLVPVGCAHGFCTLEDNTEVVFHLNARNDPDAQCGLKWNDPALGIEWPCADRPAFVYPMDQTWPALAQYAKVFMFEH